jgi:hypothetical protein
MGAVACIVSERIHWDWNFFRRKVQFFCWFADQKANFLSLYSLLSVNLTSDWIFIWYFTKKNHILRNFRTFSKLAKTTMAKINKKIKQKPAPGQDLSNDIKYEKIGSKEPRVRWLLISTTNATNRQIYISKLKPVKDIERLIKIQNFTTLINKTKNIYLNFLHFG